MTKLYYKKLIVLIMVLLVILAFAACRHDEVTPPPVVVDNTIPVIEGIAKLVDAINAEGTLFSLSDVISIDLTATYTAQDSTVYDIIFKANIEPSGLLSRNNENKIYFEIRNDSLVYLGIYYFNETLYLNLPLDEGTSSKKIYINNFALSDAITYITSQEFDDVAGVLEVINSCISTIDYNVTGTTETMVFHLDIASAMQALLDKLKTEFNMINIDDLLGIFELDTDTIVDNLSTYDTATFTVVLEDGFLASATFDSGENLEMSITSLNLSSGTSVIIIPITVSQYSEYSPTNLDVAGSIKLKMDSGSYIMPIGGIDVTSTLVDTEFVFDFRVRAQINVFLPSSNRALFELSIPDKWAISAYYDGSTGNIYADFTGINAGKILINADDLTELFNSLSTELPVDPVTPAEDSFNGDLQSILSLIGIVAPGLNIDEDSVILSLDTERFTAFFEAFGITLPLDITDAGAELERDGYDIDSISAWITMGGMSLIVEADEVSVGPSPTIPVPSGLASYIDVASLEVISLFMNGSLDLVTGSANTLTFIEAALSNIAGEDIDITTQYPVTGTLVNYESKFSIDSHDGSLQSMSIDLYDSQNRYIVGVNYIHSTGKIYIIERYTENAVVINDANEYDLSYDIEELIKTITGLADPLAPTATDAISITNTLVSLSANLNYNAFNTFINYLGNTIFNFTESMNEDYIFDNISITIGDYITGRVNFPNSKSITFTAEDISVGYAPITVTGITEATTRNINSVYANNDMPNVVTLRFSDNSEKKFKVNDWTYNLNGFINTVGGTVVASTYILGYEVKINLNVTGTSISSLISNVPNDGFEFNKNDMSINPIDYIRDTYQTMTVRLSNRDIVKDLDWDLTALNDINTNGEYQIQGIIYDYFGRPKMLPGDTLYYNVDIYGVDVLSTNLNRVFESYGGIDPTKESTYPSLAILTAAGVVTTAQGAIGEEVNLEWDLTNIINAFSAPNFDAYKQTLNVNVSVNIPNSLGTARTKTVNIIVNPAVMTGITFDDCVLGNGSSIDPELSTDANASGISWDSVNNILEVNPLRIRSLSEAILPASVIMNTNAGPFTFTGLKWEFLPLSITNDGGTYTDILKLIIGDKIGGYQETFVTVKVITLVVNDFEIQTSGGVTIPTSNIGAGALYKLYEVVNPYDYQMPMQTFVSTNWGDFILKSTWTFPTLNTASLFNGGIFESIYNAGSQELKVRLTSMPTIAVMYDGLSFDGHTTIDLDATKQMLVFNPYTSADFTDVSIYPATALATFTDGQGNTRQLIIPLKWNISAITSLYINNNPKMYEGKRITVTASTDYAGCGVQQFSVDVCIEEALIEDSEVIFSEENMSKILPMSIFGINEGNLTFIDPRISASYPSTIRVSYQGANLPSRIITMNPEDVIVASWDISSVIAAYNEVTIISGVNGIYDIIATVGTLRGGHQTIIMQVDISSSELDNVVFTNIPLLPNGNPAFLYDDTIGEDYIATFSYDPYMANIKNAVSYPSSISFDLDINGVTESFNMDINWNLVNVNTIAAYLGGEFLVNAILPLSSTGSIDLPVKLIVQEKLVDTLNGEGLFNIFIDPLDVTPFGRRNSTSMEVKQTVVVTFTDDETNMTLNLIYSRDNVNIDFGGVTYMIDAVVGNDFGGYQPIGLNGKIQLAIIQREITSICTDDEDELEIFRRDEMDNGQGVLIISELNPNILYYESKPATLLFTFTGLIDPVAIPLRTVDSVGLCYDWIDITETEAEIIIYNIIPAFMNEEDEDEVFIGNPSVSLDVVKLMNVENLLIVDGNYGVEYFGGVKDVFGDLRTAGKLNNLAMGIGNEYLEYEYYLNGELIDPSLVKNSGVYTLRIYVRGHHVYGGYDEVIYTIYKRDITDNIRIFRNAIQRNTTGNDLVESIQYNGNPISYTADADPLSYTIDVIYPNGTAPSLVGVYNIIVQVNPIHPNDACDITITLTITKVFLTEASGDVTFTHTETLIYGESDFDVTLSAYGTALDNFTVNYYEDAACTISVPDISIVDVGNYYVNVIYIGANLEVNAKDSFVVSPAELTEDDYVFTTSSMSPGGTGPALYLTILGQTIDTSEIPASYYYDEECLNEVPDIMTAPDDMYYVKIVAEIANYQAIELVQSFYISD